MRDEIKLTDEQIEKRFGRGTIDDYEWTRDSLNDFRAARERYSEPGRIVTDSADEWIVDRVQTRRGEPRADRLHVIDFGPARAALLL